TPCPYKSSHPFSLDPFPRGGACATQELVQLARIQFLYFFQVLRDLEEPFQASMTVGERLEMRVQSPFNLLSGYPGRRLLDQCLPDLKRNQNGRLMQCDAINDCAHHHQTSQDHRALLKGHFVTVSQLRAVANRARITWLHTDLLWINWFGSVFLIREIGAHPRPNLNRQLL